MTFLVEDFTQGVEVRLAQARFDFVVEGDGVLKVFVVFCSVIKIKAMPFSLVHPAGNALTVSVCVSATAKVVCSFGAHGCF